MSLRSLLQKTLPGVAFCLCTAVFAQTGTPRYVIADQDATGPGGSDMANHAVNASKLRSEL